MKQALSENNCKKKREGYKFCESNLKKISTKFSLLKDLTNYSKYLLVYIFLKQSEFFNLKKIRIKNEKNFI